MRYAAQERTWVAAILARLTPEQRRRYEAACRATARTGDQRDHRTGRLYDRARAAIAERILLEDTRQH